MRLKNAKLYGQEGLWNIEIQEDLIQSITSAETDESNSDQNEIDLNGKIVLPPYVEPHIHLDYVLTAGTPRWNKSGSVFEGIEIWSERKKIVNETKEDIKKRALKAVKMQMKHGIQYVRTHADVSQSTLTGLEALLEVKAEVSPWMDIQIVALPQEGLYAMREWAELLEKALQMEADAVGASPHYEPARVDGVSLGKTAIELDVKYDQLVDVHCDEIDDAHSRYLEVRAAEAITLGLGNKVTASHTTAMATYEDAYTYKLFQTLKKANINFIALPKANLHLQGRFDGYPKRRGITRVKELLEEGLNVCFGLDSIVDPWYPLGDGNLMS